jgi:altronate hydrolase
MATVFSEAASQISDYAIIVNPDDNVAVVKNQTSSGLELALPDGRSLCVTATVPPGHRFATRDIPAGEFVRQYGQPIGTSLGIREGDRVSHDNMSDAVPIVRELCEDLSTPPPAYFPENSARRLWDFAVVMGAWERGTIF